MAVGDNLKRNSNFVSQSDLDSAISSIIEVAESGKWNQKSIKQLDNILKDLEDINGKKELSEYLKYLKYQKNYSDYTIINYGDDIKEYLLFLHEKNINLYKITYEQIRSY
jgi:hypothetical protein